MPGLPQGMYHPSPFVTQQFSPQGSKHDLSLVVITIHRPGTRVVAQMLLGYLHDLISDPVVQCHISVSTPDGTCIESYRDMRDLRTSVIYYSIFRSSRTDLSLQASMISRWL